LGRILFAAIFLAAGPANFTPQAIGYAAQHGVPAASFLVPLSGVLALVGGLSVLFGIRARLGALLLVAFLLPVTFAMHDFWAVADPVQAKLQQINFFKNLGLTGGALMILYFGAGPLSVDAWLKKRRESLQPHITLPTGA
jgi:putative oxidoreductase